MKSDIFVNPKSWKIKGKRFLHFKIIDSHLPRFIWLNNSSTHDPEKKNQTREKTSTKWFSCHNPWSLIKRNNTKFILSGFYFFFSFANRLLTQDKHFWQWPWQNEKKKRNMRTWQFDIKMNEKKNTTGKGKKKKENISPAYCLSAVLSFSGKRRI